MNKVRRALTSAVFAALLACTFAMILDLPNSTASSSIFVSNDTYDDWAMFRHDPIHTGYSPSTGPDTNATLWTQTIGKTMYTGTLRSPAVAYGRLYVGDDEWRIHCLNASTGSPIWNYTTGSYVSACPAIAYGRVFVGSCDGTVYCLDAYTGRSIWNYTTEQPVQSSARAYRHLLLAGHPTPLSRILQ